MHLDQITAVVTGAASGIGLALVDCLLARGARVVGVDRDQDRLSSVLAQRGGQDRVLALAADVTDLDALRSVAAKAVAQFGPVDLLCNNAGIGGALGPTWELPDEEWDRVLDVNLRGVVNGIRAFVPAMVERGSGHVVNTASMAGILPMPWGSPYTASKHAVVGISSAMRMELEREAPGVGVSVLCPGWTDTGIASGADAGILEGHADGPAGGMSRMIAANVREGASAADVAEAVAVAVEQDEFWILTHPDQAAAIAPYWARASAAAGRSVDRG